MQLRKRLGLFDLVILGVAGAVGTGVLFSNAGMATLAGPGVVLAWIVGAIFYVLHRTHLRGHRRSVPGSRRSLALHPLHPWPGDQPRQRVFRPHLVSLHPAH